MRVTAAGTEVSSAGRSAEDARPLPRLLVLTPDFPPAYGGLQRVAHGLACGLVDFRTRVVTLDQQGAATFDAQGGLDVLRVRAPAGPPALRNLRLNARALAAALRFRPDLTLSLHLVTSPAAAAVRALLGARTVQYFHAQEIGGKPRLARFAAERADAVIAVSSYTAGLVRATGAAPARLELIPPGVELPADTAPLPAERPTVLTVARLVDRYKGHDVLLRALALVRERAPEVQLAVIGEGPLRGELEQLARTLGLGESVLFLGSVSEQERVRWLRSAALLAMPARLPEGRLAGEGFGIVYLEAGAYGKPVVAGNVGGAVDAVRDGESGLLVDPRDEREVAAAITRLLLEPALAERLGRGGAQRARELAWPRVAERVQALLLAQLRDAGGASRGRAR